MTDEAEQSMRLVPYDAHVNISPVQEGLPAEEALRAAEAAGLEAVGLVVGFNQLPAGPGDHLARLKVLAPTSPVHLLPAVQAEILDSAGHLGMSVSASEQFPLVLGCLSERTVGVGHDVPVRWERLVDNIFASLLGAVSSGGLNVLAYPFNLGRFPAPLTPTQLPTERVEELGDAMTAAEVACELSNRAWWWYPELPIARFTEEFAQVLRVFSRCGVKFIAGSDSRDITGVGNLRYVQRLMRAAGVERSQLVDLTRL